MSSEMYITDLKTMRGALAYALKGPEIRYTTEADMKKDIGNAVRVVDKVFPIVATF